MKVYQKGIFKMNFEVDKMSREAKDEEEAER